MRGLTNPKLNNKFGNQRIEAKTRLVMLRNNDMLTNH